MGRPCLNKGGQKGGGRWKPVADCQGEGDPRDQLNESDLIDQISVDPESVNGQKDGDETIQALELTCLITADEEPGGLPYDHIDIPCHTFCDFYLDPTEDQMCLILFYD